MLPSAVMAHARWTARLVLIGILVGACTSRTRPQVAWPDAPLALRDDSDRSQAIDELWALPPGAERDRRRAAIAAALARRITDALAEDRPFEAERLLDQLTELWHPDPTAVGRGLRAHAELLLRLRGMFARSGALEPTVQTLVLLAEVEPARRDAHRAELEEVLAFADELAIADNGPNAVRSQPLALLQPTALALPLPWLVDRYVAMSAERQRVIAKLIETEGASMQLVRAHHDVLSTSRRIANVLARAGRTDEIYRHLSVLRGLGADRELIARAEIVAEQPTPRAYVALARVLRNEERESPSQIADPLAALAVSLHGLARFPGDVSLLTTAGDDARMLGRTTQAIALYETALRGSREVDVALALRLGRLYGERLERLAASGRPRAAHEAWREVLAFTRRAAEQSPHAVWQQAAALAESSLGRGLASQGLVTDARRTLAASIERAPSIEAYETLTTIDVQTQRYATAERWARDGIALLGEQRADHYRRAKLQRLVGDALRHARDPQRSATHYLEAMRAWAALGETDELPRTIAAERALEYGKAMWWLGQLTAERGQPSDESNARAVSSVLDAVEMAPDAPAIAADAVAFLIETGRYRDAVDAYHRGLGSNLGDSVKIYMSLWIAGEARRRGEDVDRLAAEYLGSRHGDTWYELLARAASGRIAFEILRDAATTGPRRAELAFYGAVLGFHPEATTADGRRALLEQVVAAQVVFDAEYDLARRYLAAP